MIICEINKNHLNVRTRELLTAGSQNVNTVEFRFNEAWDGLAKTATFKTSKKTISVLLRTNTTAIPWEVLADAGEILAVGVFGVSGETLVLPTVWGILGKVMDAAHLGDEEKEPTPDVYQKILDELNSLEKPTWDSVQNKPFSTLGGGLEVDENGVLSAEGGGGSANAVQYVAQELTDEQKAQARNNIDADKKRIIYNATRDNYGKVRMFGNTSAQNAAIDKIIAEYKAGTEVVMRLQNSDYQLNRINENAGKIWFSSYLVDTTTGEMDVVTFTLEKDTTAVNESFINGIKAVGIDSALEKSGYAADAKAVGDTFDNVMQGFGEQFQNLIREFGKELNTKLDKNQGAGNAGKILGIGEDGIVVPQDIPQGGDNSLGITAAAVGQIIKVKSVDATGKPTEWDAADLDKDEYIVLVNTKFAENKLNTDLWLDETLYATTHVWRSATPLDLICMCIYVPAQTENIITSGELKVGVLSDDKDSNYWDLPPEAPYFGYSSFVPTNGQNRYRKLVFDLRTRTAEVEVGNNI